ncbi:hypothetical protein [Flavobacterium cerinum]|uniref:Uncharacterized protein n=1 Tax=Flavobacterium cerinum TaxID=2502784 RepID=A0ABY5IQL4_9FLAO|nr:hypothetical protein [Flavobacterium cerinum]UUC45136.1 hypothetical protein NOX80_16115 [Flavobacterium cerinum]
MKEQSLEKFKEQLSQILSSENALITKDVSDTIAANFFQIEVSYEIDYEIEDLPNNRTQYITFDDNYKGKTVKVQNLFLNYRNLFKELPDIVLTTTGLVEFPDLAFLGAIVLWNKLWAHVKVDFDEKQAIALRIMWKNAKIDDCKILDDQAYGYYNNYMVGLNRNTITKNEFDQITESLKNLKCIRKTGNENEMWELIERIKI